MVSNNKRWLQKTYTNWAFGAICPLALEFAFVGGRFVRAAEEKILLPAFFMSKPLRVEKFPNVWLPTPPTRLIITRS